MSVDLDIGGMTCAACAARIEKKLNRMAGVSATVNYATEKASVRHALDVTAGDLIAQIEATGYSASLTTDSEGGESESGAALRMRLMVCAALALPVVVLAMVPAAQFDGWQWLSLVLTTPVVVWGALPFHRSALLNLRHGTASMDTLISVGTAAAFGWSLYALVLGDAGDLSMRHGFSLSPERGMAAGQIYLEVAAGVTVFILAGRTFEARAKRASGAALRALLNLEAPDASVLVGDVEVRTPIAALRVGDRFVVRPGERIATDGAVEFGSSAVDASLLTGESVPVEVGVGDAVTGGSINSAGRLVVRATRVGSDTVLAEIDRLVTRAQTGKAQVQRLADRISAVFVPIVVALSAATCGFWITAASTDRLSTAFTAAVAVLIVACPCALGLATPTALMVGTGRGAQLSILIKGPEVLEATRAIDIVVFDKTGTITTGAMELIDIVVGAGVDVDEALSIAGSLEHASEHPIAVAIVAAVRRRNVELSPVEHFSPAGGLGVSGVVAGRSVVVGRDRFLNDRGLVVDGVLAAARDTAEAQGRTAVFAGWDGSARAVLVVADTVKPSSADVVRRLRRLGIVSALVTGDNARAAQAVANQIGIDDVFAEVLPHEKVAIIRELQQHGRTVAMVGDGVNDAAALAQADLGIAMGAGTDVAMAASDITLVRDDLRSVIDAIKLSRRTLSTIKANLFWAFAYNVAAIPLAAAGLLNPMLAGLAMACSSAFVVSNSLRLRRFDPDKQPTVLDDRPRTPA